VRWSAATGLSGHLRSTVPGHVLMPTRGLPIGFLETGSAGRPPALEPPLRALVIDDSRAMRMILRRLMTQAGFSVSEAGDGQEALVVLEESAEAFDVALVDWNMPNMNGLEFVKAVRADGRYARLTLMMVTTESEQSQIVRALAAGAHEYVIKPFTGDAIVDKLGLLGLVSLGATG
jgi:two-component system chemotaxis response regulator CheY